jgi:hypothetical protein
MFDPQRVVYFVRPALARELAVGETPLPLVEARGPSCLRGDD